MMLQIINEGDDSFIWSPDSGFSDMLLCGNVSRSFGSWWEKADRQVP